MKIKRKLDPASLVSRIVAEVQANPEAQQMLLRTLLTNEFLGMPARLDHIEKDIAELKIDVARLKTDVAELKTDVAELKTDVAQLKGSDLEHRLHRKIGSRVSQMLGLRRTRIVQGPVQVPEKEFADHVEDALDNKQITDEQEARIEATDFILHAQRRTDRVPVWIAVEASNTVHASDIDRARDTADALHAVFGVDAVAVVAGYGIAASNAERAETAEVRYLQVSQPRAN